MAVEHLGSITNPPSFDGAVVGTDVIITPFTVSLVIGLDVVVLRDVSICFREAASFCSCCEKYLLCAFRGFPIRSATQNFKVLSMW